MADDRTQLNRGVGGDVMREFSATMSYSGAYEIRKWPAVTLIDDQGAILGATGIGLPIQAARGAFYHGAAASIGISGISISPTSYTTSLGVVVKAARENSGIVYVGNSYVTAGTSGTQATDGMQLYPGESVMVEMNDPSKVWVIASVAGQKIYWTGV